MAVSSLTFLGKTYSNVEQINVGGYNFYDVSPTTAYASTVLSGCVFYEEDGSLESGTIPTKSATNVTIAGPSVTTPSGYYSQAVTKTISNATFGTGGLNIDSSTGDVTMTVAVMTSGYVSQDFNITEDSGVFPQAASTYYTSTADRTIPQYRYLAGSQTIKSVTTTNLSASYILSGITVKVGDSGNASRIAQVSGTLTVYTYYSSTSAPTAGLGNDGDIFLQIDDSV